MKAKKLPWTAVARAILAGQVEWWTDPRTDRAILRDRRGRQYRFQRKRGAPAFVQRWSNGVIK